MRPPTKAANMRRRRLSSRFARLGGALLTGAVASTVVLAAAPAGAAGAGTFTLSSVTVAADGTPPFDALAGPGDDTGPANLVVRTGDVVTYSWQWGADGDGVDDVTVVQSLPEGMTWRVNGNPDVPGICQGPGRSGSSISADGRVLTCDLGHLDGGRAGAILVSAQVLTVDPVTGRATPDGAALHSTVDAVRVAAPGTVANAGPVDAPALVASATPRADLRADEGGAWGPFTVTDPATGEPGLLTLWPVLVTSGTKLFGLEQLASPLSFTADLGAISPNTRLLDFHAGPDAAVNRAKPITGCSGNGDSLLHYNLPLGYGLGDPHLWSDNTAAWTAPVLPDPVHYPGDMRATAVNHVAGSGDWTCTQSGSSVRVTVTGADTSASVNPGFSAWQGNLSGRALPADTRYLVSGVLATFTPVTDVRAGTPIRDASGVVIGNRLDATVRFGGFAATGVGGGANFGGGGEPTTNNSYGVQMSAYFDGAYDSWLEYRQDNGGALWQWFLGSGSHTGDGVVTPGQVVQVYGGFANHTALDRTNVSWCDKLAPGTAFVDQPAHPDGGTSPVLAQIVDAATEAVVSRGGVRMTNGALPANFVVEYSARPLASPGQDTCGTPGDTVTDGPWFSSPGAVPGGPSAITRVRVTARTLPASTHLRIGLRVAVRPGTALGSRIPSFSAARVPDSAVAAWRSWYRPDTNANDSNHSDTALVANAIVRIRKALDPASTNPNQRAGNTIAYALQPSASIPGSAGRTALIHDVVVSDVLPGFLDYVPGSAVCVGSSPTACPVPVVRRDAGADAVTGTADDTTSLTWTFPDVVANAAMPELRYQTRISALTPDRSLLRNQSVISSADDPSPEGLRSAAVGIVVANPATFGVELLVDAPSVEVSDPFGYTLVFGNVSANPIHSDGGYGTVTGTSFDLIDVLPFAGDSRGSQVGRPGTTMLDSAVLGRTDGGEELLFTNAAPAGISADPADASNTLAGAPTARWCPSTALGTAGCPRRDLHDVTAVRVLVRKTLAGGRLNSVHLGFVAAANAGGDVYATDAVARAAEMENRARAEVVDVRTVASSVGDRVWRDDNGNGRQDRGEPGVGGVLVTLTGTDTAGRSISRYAVTDATGAYRIADLHSGRYQLGLGELPLDTLGLTTLRTGADRSLDSDFDPVSRVAPPVDLVTAADESGLDAGLLPRRTISGTVVVDRDGAGLPDAADGGYPGGTVELVGPDGSVVATTATAEDGSYRFTSLAPGSYAVRVRVPAGYVAAARRVGSTGATGGSPGVFLPAQPGDRQELLGVDLTGGTDSTGNDFAVAPLRALPSRDDGGPDVVAGTGDGPSVRPADDTGPADRTPPARLALAFTGAQPFLLTWGLLLAGLGLALATAGRAGEVSWSRAGRTRSAAGRRR